MDGKSKSGAETNPYTKKNAMGRWGVSSWITPHCGMGVYRDTHTNTCSLSPKHDVKTTGTFIFHYCVSVRG